MQTTASPLQLKFEGVSGPKVIGTRARPQASARACGDQARAALALARPHGQVTSLGQGLWTVSRPLVHVLWPNSWGLPPWLATASLACEHVIGQQNTQLSRLIQFQGQGLGLGLALGARCVLAALCVRRQYTTAHASPGMRAGMRAGMRKPATK